jgi:alpha-L-fucosidase 2
MTLPGTTQEVLVDPRRQNPGPTWARIRSVGGRTTAVAYAGRVRTVSLKPGESVTLKDFAR